RTPEGFRGGSVERETGFEGEKAHVAFSQNVAKVQRFQILVRRTRHGCGLTCRHETAPSG
ncbi:MAG: hypothetical protein ACNA8S_10025, partial [Deferrisomatales bacterium]